MNPETPPPPPVQLPQAPPPLPRPSGKKKTSPLVLTLIIGGALIAVLAAVAIPAAILIPTVGKVRETARRTIDASNLRQIGQAALIYASETGGRLPGRELTSEGRRDEHAPPATIHAVAAALAREGGLDAAFVWFSSSDRAAGNAATTLANTTVLRIGSLEPQFTRQKVISFDFVTGLTTNASPATPVAWTRGLRRDGRWDARSGVYGSDGGHVVFLGGTVSFFHDLSDAPLFAPDGTRTTDILQALPPGTRVVGAGPGSLDGAEGGAP